MKWKKNVVIFECMRIPSDKERYVFLLESHSVLIIYKLYYYIYSTKGQGISINENLSSLRTKAGNGIYKKLMTKIFVLEQQQRLFRLCDPWILHKSLFNVHNRFWNFSWTTRIFSVLLDFNFWPQNRLVQGPPVVIFPLFR